MTLLNSCLLIVCCGLHVFLFVKRKKLKKQEADVRRFHDQLVAENTQLKSILQLGSSTASHHLSTETVQATTLFAVSNTTHH